MPWILTVKIIFPRPTDLDDVVLTGDITKLIRDTTVDSVAEFALKLEHAINDHVTSVRAHVSIDEVG